ncbi:MAG: protein kinase [Polyangiales bacterium]
MTLRATGARIGAYTLRERLALGGMGEVWIAADASGASLVLKFPGGRNPRDPLYQELLRNEAALGRATAHPNVVRVVELGEHAGEPFLALEHVDGVDLYRLQRALQHTQRRMESPLASHLVRELLAGLGHVHALQGSGGDGLVHRDVSPSNVFLSVEGDVKLGDFGISTPVRVTTPPPALGATPTPPSLPRVQRGKLAYMAPEQLLGFGADPRVDLFAAGVILAELLTGRPLFAHGSDAGTVLSAREGQIEALNDLLADHPPSLVSVVLRALARSPAERFQTADEFRDALLPHAGDPAEARPLLAALVTWGRAATRALTNHDNLAVSAGGRERRRSTHPPPEPQHAWAPADADQTREVPLAYYEVVGAGGRARGRYTFARLLELAFTGSIEPDERVVGPDGVSRRADEMPELAAHLLSRHVTPPAVEGAQADWADALPACTFLHALARAALAEEDGMLVAEAPPARKEVFLRDGRLTHLTTNLAAESLGEYLAQAGLVNPGELDMAMAILPRFDGDLSRALVELGLVDAARLGPIVARHARERFYDLFRWRRGTLRFYRGIAPTGPGLALNLDVFEALRRGAQMLDDPAEHFAPCLDKRVGLRDTRRALPRLGLGPVALQLLGLADGHVTVRALVQRLSAEKRAPPAEVFRDLHLLIEVGAVELR